MSTLGWQKYANVCAGLDTFGASAPYKEIYQKVGLVAPTLADKAKKAIAFYAKNPLGSPIRKPF